jgi:hypothetical protein
VNKDIKTKWVEALRSGKYKQGRGFLQRNNEFCCLGVLCEVQNVPSQLVLRQFRDPFCETNHRLPVHKYLMMLDSETGICADDPIAGGLNDFEMEKLTNMNDGDEYNFEQIARYIEEEL